MTDSPRATEGCFGIEGAVGGVASTAHHALYSAPLRRHPVGQPIVFGDLSSGAVTANLGSQGSYKPLFEINVWLTMRSDLGRKVRFHQSQMPWLVPASRAALNTARWFTRGQTAPASHSE